MTPRKTKTQKIGALLLAAACIFAFSGCREGEGLPGMELSKRLLVEAVGLDAEEGKVVLTLLALNTTPTNETDASGHSAEKSQLFRFSSATVGQAAAMAEQATGRVPFFAQARLLVLGRAAAEQGVSALLDFFLRNRTVRNTVNICVAEETAASVLSYKDDAGETAPLLEQIILTSHSCGKSVKTPLFSFVNKMLSADTEACCPIVAKTKENEVDRLTVCGTAVFRGERMCCRLNEAETTALLLMLGELNEALLPLPGQTPPVTCRIRQTQARFKKAKNRPDTFDLTLRLKAEITEADGAPYPAEKSEKEKIAGVLQAEIAARTQACFEKLYHEQKTDLCRLRKKQGAHGTAATEKIRLQTRVELSLD